MRWPLDAPPVILGRNPTAGRPKSQKNIDNALSVFATGPSLSFGALGAATLDDQFQWKFISDHDHEVALELSGPTVQLISGRQRPALLHSKDSLSNRVDHALDFLHTYYPELDIPRELIIDGLLDNTHVPQTDTLSFFASEPGKGNAMTVLGTSKPVICVPWGEVGQELVFISLTYDPDNASLSPTTPEPAVSFPTEIQQIVSHRYDQNKIAVRTLTSITLLEVKRATSERPISVEVLAELDWNSIRPGGGKAVDMALSPFEPEILFVSERGSVYIANFGAEEVVILTLDTGSAPFVSSDSPESSWRVAWYSTDQILVSSDKTLVLLDRDASRAPITMYSISPFDDTSITAIEGPHSRPDQLITLTATSSVVWIDVNTPLAPAMLWKHDRDSDITLRSDTLIDASVGPFTVLSSRRNSPLTVFNVHTSDDTNHGASNILSSSSRSGLVPPPSSDPLERRKGICIVPRISPKSKKRSAPQASDATSEQGKEYWLLEFTTSYSLLVTPLRLRSHDAPGPIIPVPDPRPSRGPREDVTNMIALTSRTDLGQRADRAKTEHDFRDVLLGFVPKTNDNAAEDSEVFSSAGLDDIWEDDGPASQIVTLSEALTRDPGKPVSIHRTLFPRRFHFPADWKSSTELEEATKLLEGCSKWSLDLTPVIEAIEPGLLRSGGAPATGGATRQTNDEDDPIDVDIDEDMSPQPSISSRLDAIRHRASIELASDLALSTRAYSNAHPLIPPTQSAAQTISNLASQLSNMGLDSTLAPRQRTGFLDAKWAGEEMDASAGAVPESKKRGRPKGKGKDVAPPPPPPPTPATGASSMMPPKKAASAGKKVKKDPEVGKRGQALGVRVLMQEWVVGEDPDAYVFNPIYAPVPATAESHHQSQAQASQRQPGPSQPSAPTQPTTHPPPAMTASQPQPPLFSQVRFQAPAVLASTPVASTSTQPPPQPQPQTQPQPRSRTDAHSSLPLGAWPTHDNAQSQAQSQSQSQSQPMASTQVLPGPFGGRPSTSGAGGSKAKEKGAFKKKRAGF